MYKDNFSLNYEHPIKNFIQSYSGGVGESYNICWKSYT